MKKLYQYTLYALLAAAASCPNTVAAQDQATEAQKATTESSQLSKEAKIAIGVVIGVVVLGTGLYFGYPKIKSLFKTEGDKPDIIENKEILSGSE